MRSTQYHRHFQEHCSIDSEAIVFVPHLNVQDVGGSLIRSLAARETGPHACTASTPLLLEQMTGSADRKKPACDHCMLIRCEWSSGSSGPLGYAENAVYTG
jgi:hypothetical protein